MSMTVSASILAAIVGGTAGAALGLWIEHWMPVLPRRRPCPHGFTTIASCPTCRHFSKIRADAIQRERE